MSEQCHATFFVFRPFILQCVTCCSLFATVPQPVEKTRYINEQARPCFFFMSMVLPRHSERHEHTGENEQPKQKRKRG
ncbi:hypothetical protein B1P85_02285 [Enterococcus faecalis]|nr:hypothetical protein B1P85_02285 [Enterococcus faecalis]